MWALVLGGLAWAYEGVTGSDMIERVFRSLEPAVNVVVLGGSALYVAYHLMTHKH